MLTQENIPNLSLGNILLYITKQVLEEKEIKDEEAEALKDQYDISYHDLELERQKVFKNLSKQVSVSPGKGQKRLNEISITNKLIKQEVLTSGKVVSKREMKVLQKANPELAQAYLRKREEAKNGRIPNTSVLQREPINLSIHMPTCRQNDLVLIVEKHSKTADSSAFKVPWYIMQDIWKRRRDEPNRDKRANLRYRLHKGSLYDFAGMTFVGLDDRRYRPTTNGIVQNVLNRNPHIRILKLKDSHLPSGIETPHIRIKYCDDHTVEIDKRNINNLEIQLMSLVGAVEYEFGPDSHYLYKTRRERFADYKTAELRPYSTPEDLTLFKKIQSEIKRVLTF